MKYYLTYLPAGEFGSKEMWGIFTHVVKSASVSNWVAFYATREAALNAYPQALEL
jgi:hypothetical protein